MQLVWDTATAIAQLRLPASQVADNIIWRLAPKVTGEAACQEGRSCCYEQYCQFPDYCDPKPSCYIKWSDTNGSCGVWAVWCWSGCCGLDSPCDRGQCT